MVKSKLWLGRTLKLTGNECVVVDKSLPTPTMLKLYACETGLDTVAVKAIPVFDGSALAGLTTQLGGAFGLQFSATALAYPFMAVSVPLNVAGTLTEEVNDGLAIDSV
jgi:hypothetical protein